MNKTPQLKAFKRAPSLGLSQWENGNLTTNLAEKKDTNGAFLLMEATLAPGTEPPPHVHTREDELFYVLEGEFDVYVGEKAFNVKTGGMRVYAQIQAARICDPVAAASGPRAIHARGIGRSLPRHEHASPTSGTSHRSGHVFDR